MNFYPWMDFQFGKPGFDVKKEAGKAFDRKPIRGFEGVIGFQIGFGDATGHFDLWYQDKFSHEDNGGEAYFTRAHRISLWRTNINPTTPEV